MIIRILNSVLSSPDVTRGQLILFRSRCSVTESKVNIRLMHAMKTSEDGTVEVQFQSFLTSEQERGEWPEARPGCFTPRECCGYSRNRRWVGQRVGLDVLETIASYSCRKWNHYSSFILCSLVTKVTIRRSSLGIYFSLHSLS